MLFESLIQTMYTEKVLIEKKAHPIFLLICFNKGILLLKDCLNNIWKGGKEINFILNYAKIQHMSFLT